MLDTVSPRSFLRELRRSARRSDIMVVAAAMTCYAAFGMVPLIAIATRVASGVYGPGEVTHVAQGLARYLHGPLRLDSDVVAFSRSAATSSWWTVLFALLPVSLYAEGTVRSLERFSRAPERHSRALRGRLLTPVMTVFAVLVMLLAVGPLHPVLDDPFGVGTGARLLGILVGFNLLFFPLFGALLLVYRLFASTPLRPGPLALGAFVAASWISGQLLGYTLALRFLGGFDRAFGGFAPAGEVAAFAFLVYLEHLVFLLGYLVALITHERLTARDADRGTRKRRPAQPERSTSTTNARWSEASSAGVEVASTEPRSPS